jgi:hypothetical protein
MIAGAYSRMPMLLMAVNRVLIVLDQQAQDDAPG